MSTTDTDVCGTFTGACPCGAVRSFVDGQEDPHECRSISAQQVRDAWAEGYDFAQREQGEIWVVSLGSDDPPRVLVAFGKETAARAYWASTANPGNARGWQVRRLPMTVPEEGMSATHAYTPQCPGHHSLDQRCP